MRILLKALKEMEIPNTDGAQSTGYAALIERFEFRVAPNHTRSFVVERGSRRTHTQDGRTIEFYPRAYWPGDSVFETLEFALKYEGTNLSILHPLFASIDPEALRTGILEKPGGKYARRIWFLFEYLTGLELDLPTPRITNYVPLLNPDTYFTCEGVRSKRHRVLDNLLGVGAFCPTVRRTSRLKTASEADLRREASEILESYPADLVTRAGAYLYTKETRTSFAIENVTPGKKRIGRFVELLKHAGAEEVLTKESLVGLQNVILDKRFADADYRSDQNYVGESVRLGSEIVHYVPPKPADVDDLMSGFIETAHRLLNSDVDPVIAAAVISFGFVFIHPFTDGNGRLHRFLLHHALSRRGFTPERFIFPVSATMLRNRAQYDRMLESVSKSLQGAIDFEIDNEGRLTVLNETVDLYRYLDLTDVSEGLYSLMAETIKTDLVDELEFLVHYDRARSELQGIVDMPDRKLDLFIRLVLQNRGSLSRKKRNAHFEMLHNDEIAAMEKCLSDVFVS